MKVKWYVPFWELTLALLTALCVTTRGQDNGTGQGNATGQNNGTGQNITTSGQAAPADPGDGDPSCADKFDICPFIVQQSGEDCQDDPYFVMKYCNKSCGFCSLPKDEIDLVIEGNLARDLGNDEQGSRLIAVGLFTSLLCIVACCDICIYWFKRRAKRRRRKAMQQAKLEADRKHMIRCNERLEAEKQAKAEFERLEAERLQQEELERLKLKKGWKNYFDTSVD